MYFMRRIEIAFRFWANFEAVMYSTHKLLKCRQRNREISKDKISSTDDFTAAISK